MSSTIRSLVVKVGADLSGFKSGMTTATTGVQKFTNQVHTSQKTLSSFSTSMRSLFAGISTVAIISGLVRFSKSSLQLASDLVEVQNVVDVTFGENAKIIDKFAIEAAKKFGLAELSAKKFTGVMGAMLKASGITGNKLIEMSTNLAGLAGDLASFYNLKSEDAFEKIQAGISGEIKPLRDLGINLSEVNLEAFALSKGIKISYENMDQATRTILRYNYLMELSKDAQGDFTRTSSSYANQLRIADLNMRSFSATMGGGFMNMAYGVVRAFNDMSASLQGFAAKFEIFTRIWFGDAKAMSSAGGVVVDSTDDLTAAQNKLDKALKKSSSSAKGGSLAFDKLNVLQEKTAESAGAASLADYMNTFNNSTIDAQEQTGVITEELSTWSDKIKTVYDTLYGFGERMGLAWLKVKEVFGGLWDGFKEKFTLAWGKIVYTWNTFWTGAKNAWTSLWNTLKEKFTLAWEKISFLWTSFWDGVKISWTSFWDTFKERWGTPFADIKTGWNNFWDGVKNGWGNIWAGISDRWDALKKGWNEFIESLPDWLTGKKKVAIPTYSTVNSSNPMQQLEQYALGTDYVPQTGPAIIHQGERITPAAQNPFNGDSETNRLLRQLIAIEQAKKTSFKIGSKEIIRATFNDLMEEARRSNTAWPVPAR